MDNKASPEESLTLFKKVTDSGIRYIVQGQGWGAAGALIEAVTKWNDRNPDKTVLFLNYASNDPDLTNGKCSKWCAIPRSASSTARWRRIFMLADNEIELHMCRLAILDVAWRLD